MNYRLVRSAKLIPEMADSDEDRSLRGRIGEADVAEGEPTVGVFVQDRGATLDGAGRRRSFHLLLYCALLSCASVVASVTQIKTFSYNNS